MAQQRFVVTGAQRRSINSWLKTIERRVGGKKSTLDPEAVLRGLSGCVRNATHYTDDDQLPDMNP
ncbi:MAG: hypothetical protein Q7R85_01225 [bacterium]|nr:hypothetical protein [bacterium]